MRQASNRIRELREALRGRFGAYYSIRACAERAGIAERAWTGYERGESMPPADTAVAIARILGVTVEQLDFRRVDPDREPGPAPPTMTELPDTLPCTGTFRVGSFVNNCRLPGVELHLIEFSRGPRIEDRVVLGVCPLHYEPIAPWAKELGPDLRKLIPSLDLIEGAHPLRERLEMGDEPFWTNVGIAPRTRKWFKTRRPPGSRSAERASPPDSAPAAPGRRRLSP